MAQVIATLHPEEGEKEIVEEELSDIGWLENGADPTEAEVVLCFWPREELQRAGVTWSDFSALKLIQVATAGVNHIGWRDIPPEITVANAPGSSAEAVSEYILAAVLQWTRGFQRFTRDIREGGWPLGAPVKALSELKVGLVGFGGIGTATASRLSGLGATVRAVNKSGQASMEDLAAVEDLTDVEGLPDLASWADALVVCVPLVRETLGLVDGDLLHRMDGRDALLVNVARGPVVDEGDLYEWLEGEPDSRAAVLDVWWRYPKNDEERPFDRPFDRLHNLVMTPHNAPNVTGFRHDMLRQAARQVARYLETGESEYIQDREAHLLDVEGDGR